MSEVRLAVKRVERAQRIRDRVAASLELFESAAAARGAALRTQLADAERVLADEQAELDRQVTAEQSRARAGGTEFLPTP
jgi:hypothetical protein